MTMIEYIPRKFNTNSESLIDKANSVITEYRRQGFDLTLRQLYYQMVARDVIPNTPRSYKRFGDLMNNARLAGRVSWSAIVDRTRNLKGRSHWTSPAGILQAAAGSYHEDVWADQPFRPEIWIEKDALTGVIAGVCRELDVPYFSCRGYASQSEVWEAGHRRLRRHQQNGQTPYIIHLADHDPSGIDMTRDLIARLQLFAGDDFDLQRIALTMDQVEQYSPPPNPAKLTDSRADGYIAEYGTDSWELDALEPAVIGELISSIVRSLISWEEWNEAWRQVEIKRQLLTAISDHHIEIEGFLIENDLMDDDDED